MSEKQFYDKNFSKFLGIVGIKRSLHVADVEARPELAAPQKKSLGSLGPNHLFLLWKIAACYFLLII